MYRQARQNETNVRHIIDLINLLMGDWRVVNVLLGAIPARLLEVMIDVLAVGIQSTKYKLIRVQQPVHITA